MRSIGQHFAGYPKELKTFWNNEYIHLNAVMRITWCPTILVYMYKIEILDLEKIERIFFQIIYVKFENLARQHECYCLRFANIQHI